jgi:hypothetical protein
MKRSIVLAIVFLLGALSKIRGPNATIPSRWPKTGGSFCQKECMTPNTLGADFGFRTPAIGTSYAPRERDRFWRPLRVPFAPRRDVDNAMKVISDRKSRPERFIIHGC